MPRHNVQCASCGKAVKDYYLHDWPDKVMHTRRNGTVCGEFVIQWSFGNRQVVALPPNESVVVWRDPKTGKLKYPGRTDTPMPEYYRVQGYERVELRHDHEVGKFEKEHGVLNERRHFDTGSGHDFMGN